MLCGAHSLHLSGLGLLEFLQFFEDVGMEPIMAVWAGKFFYLSSVP